MGKCKEWWNTQLTFGVWGGPLIWHPLPIYAKMKVDSSFQMTDKHLQLLLQSRFPTTWWTLPFMCEWCIKYMFYHMYRLSGPWSLFYHFLIVKTTVCEMSAGLIWSIRFEMALAGTKKQRWKNSIFRVINVVFNLNSCVQSQQSL